MPNKKDQELPEAANQKEIETKLKSILGPNAEEATHEEAESLRRAQDSPQPETPADKVAPSAPELTATVNPDPETASMEDPVPASAKPAIVTAAQPTADAAETPEAEDAPEDDTTDKAVDDIVAQEGDEVLEAEDKEIEEAFAKPDKQGFKAKLKQAWARWWSRPATRWGTIITFFAIVIAVFAVPASRYFLLNTAGARSSVSVTVLDASTQQPLKNVSVKAGTVTAVTDGDGSATLSRVKLGKTELTIEKRAFAPTQKTVTLGWGSNPLGNVSLKAVGAQYTFIVKDWLSGKPVEKAEASSGDADAVSDKDGKIVLTVDTSDTSQIDVTIKADSYRDEALSFDAADKAQQNVSMVTNRKEVFVSKRSGRYDLYKVDIDGKNESLVLAGTGYEQDNIAIISHPTDETVAYISTRDNVRDKDGYLLSTVLLVDLKDNSTKKIAQSERIDPLGWIGDDFIYAQIAAGTSANNPKRYRLMSYDYKTSENKEIASSNSFNDALIAAGTIYYAPSSAFQPASSVGLFKASADGSSRLAVSNQEVWNIFRTAYDTFDLSVQQDWYEYKLGDIKTRKLSGQPANLNGRVYIDSPTKSNSLWVDQRDGKGVLLVYDITGKTDKTLLTQSGLSNPIRWLDDKTVVFRVHTDQETADYVLSLDGGSAKKVKDVTNTLGIDKWYYY